MTILVEQAEIVVPGQEIAKGDHNFGPGIYKRDNSLYSKYVGIISVKGKSLKIKPFKGTYYPKVGDVIIGLVQETMLTSWKVDIIGPYIGILLAADATRRFDPIKDDARKIFKAGDAVKAEITTFDRTRDPRLTTKFRGLGKLSGGRIIEVNPNQISRIIGRKGSMVSLIKNLTNTKIVVGNNGRIWISGASVEDEMKAIAAIRQIERESHVKGLSNRIEKMLKEGSLDTKE